MSYEGPNFTAIPNVLLDDHMADMKEAELRITLAIARKTFGWHKSADQLSLSQLMELTGLSRQGVINGVEAGIKRGTINKKPAGQTFIYSLVVNEVDQSNKPTSQLSRLALVNEVDQLSPKLVNEVDTQKKDLINKDLNKVLAAPAPLTDQQEWFGVVCAIVAWDYKTLGAKEKAQVAQTIGILKNAGYTLEEAKSFLEKVWMKDWRYKKDGQMPTLTQLRTEIGKLRTAAPIIAKETSAYASFG
jgi:phage replication O-like protein O